MGAARGAVLELAASFIRMGGPVALAPPECVKTMSAPGRAELFGRQLRSSGRALRGRDFRTRVRLSRPGVSPTRLAPCPMNAAECPVSPGCAADQVESSVVGPGGLYEGLRGRAYSRSGNV